MSTQLSGFFSNVELEGTLSLLDRMDALESLEESNVALELALNSLEGLVLMNSALESYEGEISGEVSSLIGFVVDGSTDALEADGIFKKIGKGIMKIIMSILTFIKNLFSLNKDDRKKSLDVIRKAGKIATVTAKESFLKELGDSRGWSQASNGRWVFVVPSTWNKRFVDPKDPRCEYVFSMQDSIRNQLDYILEATVEALADDAYNYTPIFEFATPEWSKLDTQRLHNTRAFKDKYSLSYYEFIGPTVNALINTKHVENVTKVINDAVIDFKKMVETNPENASRGKAVLSNLGKMAKDVDEVSKTLRKLLDLALASEWYLGDLSERNR